MESLSRSKARERRVLCTHEELFVNISRQYHIWRGNKSAFREEVERVGRRWAK